MMDQPPNREHEEKERKKDIQNKEKTMKERKRITLK